MAERSLRGIRVLHLVRNLATGGGIQTYVANAVASLQSSAVVSSVASVFPGDLPSQLAGIDHHAGVQASLGAVRAWRFGRWLRCHVTQFDVVHIHGLFTSQFLVGAAIADAAGVAFVASPHGCLEPWFLQWRGPVRRQYARAAARFWLPRAFATVVTAPTEAETVRALDPRLRVDVVCPGIAVPPLALQGPPEQPGGALRILYLSQLEPKKGLPVLLRAMRKLCDASMPVTLQVVGSGTDAYEREIRREVQELQLQRAVAFHGFLSGERKAEVMRAAHVLALPSFSENFGFVIAEAMAAGLPVVTTRDVALHEAVQRGGAGLVVDAGDVGGLAAALAAYRDPALRAQVGRNGHQCAMREFSLPAMGTKLEALYLAAAADRC